MENKGEICGRSARIERVGDKEGGGHMLNAEMEDEIVCVCVYVWGGGGGGHINSSHVQAPASPGNPVLHVPASPPRGYSPASMCLILSLSVSHRSPFLRFLVRRLQSWPDSLLILILSFIGAIVVGPGDTDEGGVSCIVANANPLRSLLLHHAVFCQQLGKQTKEVVSEKEEATN